MLFPHYLVFLFIFFFYSLGWKHRLAETPLESDYFAHKIVSAESPFRLNKSDVCFDEILFFSSFFSLFLSLRPSVELTSINVAHTTHEQNV